VPAAIVAGLACVASPDPAAAVPAPDPERLAAMRTACESASAVRVITTRGSFMPDRPSLDEAGVRLSIPGVAEEGDNFMLLLAGLTFSASTAIGYLYGTGYPVWSRVYP
jgi:hypothetical protein